MRLFEQQLREQVLKIKELSVAGSMQLAVDLEYLRKAW